MKVLVVFGTRPEAIKMAPIVHELKARNIDSKVCVTAQHRQMLDSVLEIFKIVPDYDLNIFKDGQTLTEITTRSITGLEEVIKDYKPDLLLIQGDTSTVFSGALAAFYQHVKVGHVEAGLRSFNLQSPWPEEANRKLVSVISDFNFCPTDSNRQNLLKEGYTGDNIYLTGNTVIDALKYAVNSDYEFEDEFLRNFDFDKGPVILLTSHRRENIGEPMRNIFKGIKDALDSKENAQVIFPIHLNPKVREIAREIFADDERIHLIEPLQYLPFSKLMSKVSFVVTDSGGVQEEAPALGKPVVVVRDETERMEGVEAGTAKLVGTSYEKVYEAVKDLLTDEKIYMEMAHAVNPYGDGTSAKKIVDAIVENM